MTDKKKQGRTNRNKGFQFERDIVTLLREAGYKASTSRFSSRELDNQGVDIYTTAPINIQAKNVDRLSPPAHDILKAMPKNKTPVLFHKRKNKGVIVSMLLEDFLTFIE